MASITHDLSIAGDTMERPAPPHDKNMRAQPPKRSLKTSSIEPVFTRVDGARDASALAADTFVLLCSYKVVRAAAQAVAQFKNQGT